MVLRARIKIKINYLGMSLQWRKKRLVVSSIKNLIYFIFIFFKLQYIYFMCTYIIIILICKYGIFVILYTLNLSENAVTI